MKEQEVIVAVNEAIHKASADPASSFWPVNWAAVVCNEARQFKEGAWYVVITDASPDADALVGFITDHLAKMQIKTLVKCEW